MTRYEFMDIVYNELHSDGDNNRANRIIDAADEYNKAERESVLGKIRAEMKVAMYVDKDTMLCKNANASGLEVAMRIIDKYKAESEK